MSKEAYVHLVVLSLQDFGWPVAKTFHLGPNQVMAGALPRNRENLSGTRCNRRDQLIYRDRSVKATDIRRTVKLHFSAAVSTNICTNKDHFSAAKRNKVEI